MKSRIKYLPINIIGNNNISDEMKLCNIFGKEDTDTMMVAKYIYEALSIRDHMIVKSNNSLRMTISKQELPLIDDKNLKIENRPTDGLNLKITRDHVQLYKITKSNSQLYKITNYRKAYNQ